MISTKTLGLKIYGGVERATTSSHAVSAIMSPASLATATTRRIAAWAMPRCQAVPSPPLAARLAKSSLRLVPTRAGVHSLSRPRRAVRWKRAPSRDARGVRASTAGERSGAARVSSKDARPHPDAANASRLLGLLRANAYVELVGSAAVAFRPDAVFPDISTSAAGAECARWYALALAVFAIASFACGGAHPAVAERDDESMRTLKAVCFPTAASMALYHFGVSLFLASAVTQGAASLALRGALAVHAPLALAFALATGFCARVGAGRSGKQGT